MKLRRLNVHNLRLLRDFELRCVDDAGNPRQWTVLVGRNGTGKSTVLQAIALAAAGEKGADSLAKADVASFADRRLKGADVEIEADFDLPQLGPELRLRPRPKRLITGDDSRLQVRLRLPYGGKYFKGNADSPLDQARDISAPWFFVAGFGTRRSLTTVTARPDRPHEQRLESLFSTSTAPPIGLGFADRQSYSAAFVKAFLRILKEVLVGGSDEVGAGLTPLISNIELRGAGGVSSVDLAEKDKFEMALPGTGGLKIPATYLSHGYQSTVAWVAELIGQFLLDFAEDEHLLDRLERQSLTGLVIIDELDLFLHPDWQVQFIEDLSAAFPNLQFIVTTHSPLLIARRRPEEVVVLDWNAEGSVEAKSFEGDPRLMNASELYRRMFGLDDTPPTALAQDVAQYNFMARLRARSAEGDAELDRLWARLQEAGVKGLSPPPGRVGG